MSGPIEVGQIWQDVRNGRNVRVTAVDDEEVSYTDWLSTALSSFTWYFTRTHRRPTMNAQPEQGSRARVR